jgi:hypothetical protein
VRPVGETFRRIQVESFSRTGRWIVFVKWGVYEKMASCVKETWVVARDPSKSTLTDSDRSDLLSRIRH